mgnify:CR=1 FL=1
MSKKIKIMALKTLAELKTGRDFNDVLESYSNIKDTVGFQDDQATTADSTAAITAANIATGIVQCTPTADREKDTDTAANLISGLKLTRDNDSFDFSIINLATDGTSFITVDEGTGVTLVGNMVVSAQDAAEDAFTSGVGMFRIRRTSSTAVTLYRIA